MPKRNANISTATATAAARVATVSRCLPQRYTGEADNASSRSAKYKKKKKNKKKNRSKTRFERQRAALKSVWWFPATTAGNHATWRRRHPSAALTALCTPLYSHCWSCSRKHRSQGTQTTLDTLLPGIVLHWINLQAACAVCPADGCGDHDEDDDDAHGVCVSVWVWIASPACTACRVTFMRGITTARCSLQRCLKISVLLHSLYLYPSLPFSFSFSFPFLFPLQLSFKFSLG